MATLTGGYRRNVIVSTADVPGSETTIYTCPDNTVAEIQLRTATRLGGGSSGTVISRIRQVSGTGVNVDDITFGFSQDVSTAVPNIALYGTSSNNSYFNDRYGIREYRAFLLPGDQVRVQTGSVNARIKFVVVEEFNSDI